MSLAEFMSTEDVPPASAGRSRIAVVEDFARSGVPRDYVVLVQAAVGKVIGTRQADKPAPAVPAEAKAQ